MRLIDKDAILHDLENGVYPASMTYTLAVDIAKGLIEVATEIDAVPAVRGEWKQGREFPTYPRVPFIGTAYYCSNCEGEAYWDTDYGQQLFKFCPNCGADMRGSEVKE